METYICQFLVSFIATTSGVVLALFLQKWYESRKEANETESIKCKFRTPDLAQTAMSRF